MFWAFERYAFDDMLLQLIYLYTLNVISCYRACQLPHTIEFSVLIKQLTVTS